MNENMKKVWESFKEMVENAKEVETISMDAEIKEKTDAKDCRDASWLQPEKTGRVFLKVIINNK